MTSIFKKILSYILIHLFFIGGPATVYLAPTITSTTTAAITSTTTKTTSKATSTQAAIPNTKPKTKVAPKTQTAISKATSTPPQPTEVLNLPVYDFDTINTYARSAVVNILCITNGGGLSPISGTGIMVTPNGLILTNAHIAQYYLLKDYLQKDLIQCKIRTGSPATPRYNAELVYISPTWVENNKDLLTKLELKGTGENDFAFLRITDAIDGTNLPQNFPFIRMDARENLNTGDPVLLASYPAEFLGGISIFQDLAIASSITTIRETFTFTQNYVDVIAVPGTIVSQKGSSGGAVVDKYATLIGLISTSSSAPQTGNRALNAISIAYINRDLKGELGVNLEQFVEQDLGHFAKLFQTTTAPNLTKLITDELSRQ